MYLQACDELNTIVHLAVGSRQPNMQRHGLLLVSITHLDDIVYSLDSILVFYFLFLNAHMLNLLHHDNKN